MYSIDRPPVAAKPESRPRLDRHERSPIASIAAAHPPMPSGALLAMQRAAGNRAMQRFLAPDADAVVEPRSESPQGPTPTAHPARTAPVLQRGIRKTGKGGKYVTAPSSYNGKTISPAMKAVLVKIIRDDLKHKTTGKDYTMPQAMARAKVKVMKGGRIDLKRQGTRLLDARSMRKHLKTLGADTTLTKQKFLQHAPAYDSILNSAMVVQEDFATVKFKGNPQADHTLFTKQFAATIPRLVRTSSAFDEICTAATTGVPASGSLKGSWFEEWSRAYVLNGKQRLSFAKQGNMSKKRSSDGYDAGTKTLWDMKNYPGAMPVGTSDNQADDYLEIVTNGYASTSGHFVNVVNYLFPTKAAAMANAWLSANPYNFGVYYPSTGPNPALVKQS